MRSFCGHCASPTPLMHEAQEAVLLMPGTLDTAYEGRLARHIFVGSKADWWTITGEAPQFEEHAG